jgi:hypothetical protein
MLVKFKDPLGESVLVETDAVCWARSSTDDKALSIINFRDGSTLEVAEPIGDVEATLKGIPPWRATGHREMAG